MAEVVNGHSDRTDMKDTITRGALVAIAIAALLIALLYGLDSFRGGNGGSPTPNKDRYQAVFLTNGQVYFGKLTGLNGSYAKLDDVYYIQQQPQGQGQNAQQAQNNLSLVQLGKEIHGPERAMSISTQQILFWEDLKDDGKVVDAIKKGVTNPGDNTNAGQGGSQAVPGQGGNQGGGQGTTGAPNASPRP